MKSFKNIMFTSATAVLVFFTAGCLKENVNESEGTLGEFVSLFAMRQAYQGNEITLSANSLGGASKITGIVISDKSGLNIEPGTFVLQQTNVTQWLPGLTNSCTKIHDSLVIRCRIFCEKK